MLWPLAEQVLQAIGSHYVPVMQQIAQQSGAVGWSMLMAARTLEPDPVSAARLMLRSPYFTEAVLQDRLTALARNGFLDPSARRSFRLSEKGREMVETLFREAYAVMEPLQPLPPEQLARLSELLWKIVAASLEAARPFRKWCLEHSRKEDGGEALPLVGRIDQYLSDLSAFRDDCHMNAWRIYGVSGQAWESFTLIWRGQAASLDDLQAATLRRSAPAGTYGPAAHELARKGWITSSDDHYELTPEGKSVREAVEALTDEVFYAPWSALAPGEKDELKLLLEGMLQGLEAKTSAPEEPSARLPGC